MRGNELLDRMDLIDPEYVEAADAEPKNRRHLPMGWIATAACFCLLLAGVWMGMGPVSIPDSTDPTDQTLPSVVTVPITIIEPIETIQTQPEILWLPHYNHYDENTIVADGKLHIPCYFAEKLTESELDSILPQNLPENMEVEGYAGFSGAAGLDVETELWMVGLSFIPEQSEAALSLQVWKHNYADCVILGREPVVSNWEGTDYTLYEYQTADGLTHLTAEAERGGWFWYYHLSIPTEEAEQGKDLLESVICSFETVPDFSTIQADVIPEYRNEQITHETALNDPDFGNWFLRRIPEGFSAESICRYKDYQTDMLYGLWYRGYEELYWRVSQITDSDRCRITSVATKENYDLSLYPIPRADSVPEELREIVDNPIFLAEDVTLEVVKARAYRINDAGDTDGWRMHFSVLYGNILVEVRTKGVDPEWLYDQLITLHNS